MLLPLSLLPLAIAVPEVISVHANYIRYYASNAGSSNSAAAATAGARALGNYRRAGLKAYGLPG